MRSRQCAIVLGLESQTQLPGRGREPGLGTRGDRAAFRKCCRCKKESVHISPSRQWWEQGVRLIMERCWENGRACASLAAEQKLKREDWGVGKRLPLAEQQAPGVLCQELRREAAGPCWALPGRCWGWHPIALGVLTPSACPQCLSACAHHVFPRSPSTMSVFYIFGAPHRQQWRLRVGIRIGVEIQLLLSCVTKHTSFHCFEPECPDMLTAGKDNPEFAGSK